MQYQLAVCVCVWIDKKKIEIERKIRDKEASIVQVCMREREIMCV